MITCPLENVKISSCKVIRCMYFSNKLNGCGYAELHGKVDIQTIALHKGCTVKEASALEEEAKGKSKYILVLDEYVHWTHEKFGKLLDRTVDEDEVLNLISESVITLLPFPAYPQLIPFLIDQDMLDKFLEYKDLDEIRVEDLFFDMDTNLLRSFC